MRVLVTGAAGFVGRTVTALLPTFGHEPIPTDGAMPGGIAGDLTDADTIARLIGTGCEAVIHLAAVPGGACEQSPAAGWAVNVAATRALAEAAAAAGVRFVYASSIAVLGTPMTPVDDATRPAPAMLYGAHKQMMEDWLAMLARRGDLAAVSLRLPGIVARPGDGAGLKSAFLSAVFHAVAADRPITLPVSPAATSWLLSARQAAHGLIHALRIEEAALPDTRVLTLPALSVTMADLIAALEAHCRRPARVTYAPDPAIEAAFGAYPPLATPAADALGFAHDGDLATLVTRALGAA